MAKKQAVKVLEPSLDFNQIYMLKQAAYAKKPLMWLNLKKGKVGPNSFTKM